MEIGETVRITNEDIVGRYNLPEENSGEIIDDHDAHDFDFVVEVRDNTGDIRHLSLHTEEISKVQ